MSIASRIKEMINHTNNTYNKLENLGEDFSNTDKNIENISNTLQNIYDNWPKVTSNNVTTANLAKTKSALAKIDLKGNTEQFTTTDSNITLNLSGSQSWQQTSISFSGSQFIINRGSTGGISYLPYSNTISYEASQGDVFRFECKYKSGTINLGGTYSWRLGVYGVRDDDTITDRLNDLSINKSSTSPSGTNTFIVPEDIKGFKLGCYIAQETNTTDGDVIFDLVFYRIGEPNSSIEIPVEVVSGENTLKVVNKNLLEIPNGTYSKNGIDVSIVNSVISINGTATGTSNTSISISNYKLSKPGTYTISCNTDISSYGNNLQLGGYVYNADGTYKTNLDVRNANKTQTISNGEYISNFWIYIYKNTTINNIQVSVQLEENSTATTYEEHKEQDFPISLSSRNLLKMNETRTLNGITVTNNGDGSITVNGTATKTMDFYIANGLEAQVALVKAMPNGTTLTQRINEISGSHSAGYLFIETITYDGTSNNYTNLRDNISYTFTYDGWIRATDMYVQSGVTFDNWTIKPQLEYGSAATEYQSYYNYELCKIGDYQDYIYSIRGKNLFDKDNILLGYALNADTGLPFTNVEFITSDFIEIEFNNSYIANGGTGTRILYCYYDSNKNYLGTRTEVTYNTPFIIRNSSAKYIRVCFNDTTNYSNIQLERGSIATSYEPYGSKNLYWYIKKKTNKVVLNGSETIYDNWQNGNISDYIQFYLKSDFLGGNYAESSNQAAYSNYFRCLSSTVWRYV